jgi:hypothetical protein
MIDDHEKNILQKFNSLQPILDERSRRLWAAVEAKSLGHGGISIISKAIGISRTTIHQGIKELLESPVSMQDPKRIRLKGGGRKSIIVENSNIIQDLEGLVDPVTRGDPESPLRWTCKSTRQLSTALQAKGYKIGRQKVSELLAEMGYSLQANQKIREGSSHPDRDGQFAYINDRVAEFQIANQPVISVDTKKKELVGDFKNGGQEWRPKGKPEAVRVHDFIDKTLGKVNPYGVYDQTANAGWVSVGTDHDTAEFAVESIRRWWKKMGMTRYPKAKRLMITADGGGSNGYRVRLWKLELQRFATEAGLEISVSHFPPGTSKWNKIEHRMFSHITMNWRGKPLTNHEVIINLIANTRTRQGLQIQAELDTNSYAKGIKVTDTQLNEVNLIKSDFHGEWNYSIAPKCSG